MAHRDYWKHCMHNRDVNEQATFQPERLETVPKMINHFVNHLGSMSYRLTDTNNTMSTKDERVSSLSGGSRERERNPHSRERGRYLTGELR